MAKKKVVFKSVMLKKNGNSFAFIIQKVMVKQGIMEENKNYKITCELTGA